MDTRQMEYVLAVADELNFTRAAERCSIGQSGLSHQIAELERELGVRLFDRTSRRVQVTAAGQTFVGAARRVLQTVQEMSAAIAAIDGRIQGTLHLAVVSLTAGDIDVLGLLREFQQSCPEVEVVVSDDGSPKAVAQLLTGEVEVAIVGLQEDQLPPELAYHLIRLHPLVAVVGRQHLLRGTAITGVRALVDERFLDCAPETGLRTQVDAAFGRVRGRRRSACVLRDVGDLASLALEGIGVAIVPRPVAEAIVPADQADCVLRLDDPLAVQPLALAHRRPAPVSPGGQAFLRLALSRLSSHAERASGV